MILNPGSLASAAEASGYRIVTGTYTEETSDQGTSQYSPYFLKLDGKPVLLILDDGSSNVSASTSSTGASCSYLVGAYGTTVLLQSGNRMFPYGLYNNKMMYVCARVIFRDNAVSWNMYGSSGNAYVADSSGSYSSGIFSVPRAPYTYGTVNYLAVVSDEQTHQDWITWFWATKYYDYTKVFTISDLLDTMGWKQSNYEYSIDSDGYVAVSYNGSTYYLQRQTGTSTYVKVLASEAITPSGIYSRST